MFDHPPVAAPRLTADLLLLHAPAFFDFRNRADVYFPYLSTSGDVPITPLYEYFPLGFKTLQRYLTERGHSVQIANISTLLLKYPDMDLVALLKAANVRVFGIDLHWLVHVQGSLALAALLKRIHPDVPIVFGGISSTYFAEELIRYPAVDMVMAGYDTHAGMAQLLEVVKGDRDFARVPNLAWKKAGGAVVRNAAACRPEGFSLGVDWSTMPQATAREVLPIREIVTAFLAGCAHQCGWCGGSRTAFRRLYGDGKPVVYKPRAEIEFEFGSIRRIPHVEDYHLYSVGAYNETPEQIRFVLEQVAAAGLKSVSYEQHSLTPEPILRDMARAHPRTIITLSPESHDMRVARLAGRGTYTPEEMEAWIERALELGIHEIDVWYFIGMPEQDADSVAATVDYCAHLLHRFRGRRVMPLLCPMIPFLDPGSAFFEDPEPHGYRVFYRTLEEHRRGMLRASLINRINYETRWLSRADLVHVGYAAVRQLTQVKEETGMLSAGIAESVIARIDDALEFIDVVDAVDNLPDQRARVRELDRIGDEIRRRNAEVFFSGVANQAVPIRRRIGGRWFDEIPWEARALEAMVAEPAAAGPAR